MEALESHLPGVRRIQLENVFYADNGDWIESLLVTSSSGYDPETVLEPLSRVELFHHNRLSDEQADQHVHRLTVIAHEPYPFLLGLILRVKAIPNRLVLSQDSFKGVATVAEWENFRTLADRIESQFDRFELLSVNQVETTGASLGNGQLGRVVRNELSRDQLIALRTAYKMGYFDTPRRSSADEIATELNIAQSTFSERLRLTQETLLELIFVADENGSELKD